MARVLNVNDTRDILTVSQYVNEVSGGIFWAVMLGVIWIVLFFGGFSLGKSASRGFTLASFVCSVLGSLLAILEILNPNFLYLLILMTGFGIMWLRFEDAPS